MMLNTLTLTRSRLLADLLSTFDANKREHNLIKILKKSNNHTYTFNVVGHNCVLWVIDDKTLVIDGVTYRGYSISSGAINHIMVTRRTDLSNKIFLSVVNHEIFHAIHWLLYNYAALDYEQAARLSEATYLTLTEVELKINRDERCK